MRLFWEGFFVGIGCLLALVAAWGLLMATLDSQTKDERDESHFRPRRPAPWPAPDTRPRPLDDCQPPQEETP